MIISHASRDSADCCVALFWPYVYPRNIIREQPQHVYIAPPWTILIVMYGWVNIHSVKNRSKQRNLLAYQPVHATPGRIVRMDACARTRAVTRTGGYHPAVCILWDRGVFILSIRPTGIAHHVWRTQKWATIDIIAVFIVARAIDMIAVFTWQMKFVIPVASASADHG